MAYQLIVGRAPEEWGDTANREEELEWEDGDFSKVNVIDFSDDGGLRISQNGNFDSGRPIDGTHMPTKLRRKTNYAYPLGDIQGIHRSFLLSQKTKDIIEEFEPGIHQFFPIEVVQRRKTLGTHYYFVPCQRLDSLDFQATIPPLEPGQRRWKRDRGGNNKIVFSRPAIGDAHCWCDMRIPRVYISDALAQAFRDAKLTRWTNEERRSEV